MDFNSTVDLIIKELNEAREIIDDLKNYPDVPLLQIELAKSKCKSASEVISLLKKVQMPVKNTEKKESIPNTEPSIIADTFTSQSETLNDQLGSLKDDTDLHNVIKHKPLLKLSDEIGVNDKFLFIKEIFNGNPEAYNQAITKLDETESLADAKAIIMSYSGENDESGAAGQLLDLVKRKFPGDE
ncbi:MAG: hypothetical protein ABSA76_14340 [Bacteroidales bacterium]